MSRPAHVKKNTKNNLSDASSKLALSLIVPTWREGGNLVERVSSWCRYSGLDKIIICQADTEVGRNPFTKTQSPIPIRWTSTRQPNRGRQLNLGAREASGDILLFHHLDSELRPEHLSSIRREMICGHHVGGAFYRHFDERHPLLRHVEPLERFHVRKWGTLYGDQSIFVRREHFETIGGFAEYPLMEDVEFSKRLRSSGPLALLDPPMASSPRRHLRQGPWKTTLRNLGLIALYRMGVSPDRLHSMYYQKNSRNGEYQAHPSSLTAENKR